MPIYFINEAQEYLSYTPDQQAFRNMPVAFVEALQAYMDTVDALSARLQPCGEAGLLPLDVLPITLERPELLTLALAFLQRDQSEDGTFFYRRLPSNVRARILGKWTVNGVTDVPQARWEMGYEALTGWKNVRFPDGSEVPFSKDKIAGIPGNIVADIGTLCDDHAPEDYLKNWLGSLNGTARSTGSVVGSAASS